MNTLSGQKFESVFHANIRKIVFNTVQFEVIFPDKTNALQYFATGTQFRHSVLSAREVMVKEQSPIRELPPKADSNPSEILRQAQEPRCLQILTPVQ